MLLLGCDCSTPLLLRHRLSGIEIDASKIEASEEDKEEQQQEFLTESGFQVSPWKKVVVGDEMGTHAYFYDITLNEQKYKLNC